MFLWTDLGLVTKYCQSAPLIRTSWLLQPSLALLGLPWPSVTFLGLCSHLTHSPYSPAAEATATKDAAQGLVKSDAGKMLGNTASCGHGFKSHIMIKTSMQYKCCIARGSRNIGPVPSLCSNLDLIGC